MFVLVSIGYKFLITFIMPKYESTFLVFILLFVFYLFNLLYVYEQNYLITHKKYKILVLSYLLVAVMNLFINYMLSIYNLVELLIIVSILFHFILWRLLVFKVKRC